MLEATMIVIDNSESSRNGDYVPTRFDAQADAVNLIYNAKTNANPESSVGLMSMGGQGPEVLTTLTTDMGKILDGIHRTKIKGDAHFTTGLNIAALALKHRQNKSQHQRIIVFACSAIEEDDKSLVKLAKRMKKNNVCIDVIAFGDLSDENIKKLTSFNETIQGGDGSHLEIIPPGPNLLSDSILSTPILAGDGLGGSGGGGAGGEGGAGASNDFEFGVNPELDPELALALRMSFEEEQARVEKEKKAKEEKEKLEGIPEEEQALLDSKDEPSEGSKDKKDKKDKPDDDKMDTA
ncbi:putative 1-aminocyclopropane-1-carboxylate deaminase [Venturia nashicola]|uniref:Putative 1-aminocyclopropane-1-carboxylate deaminase n=1 Tax=Venturia nashicola TaxID=86259 RepID=A0A4Z1NZE5_9PEZI|nr:putative 1-aminocyclopropane-1-carboxylate deaminase [Venturia nashicola]TLD25864.1 putative 1-aminocyclopropane-1-carboxylate deaminase [Venturia nashicola]